MKIYEEKVEQQYRDNQWHIEQRSLNVTPAGVTFFLVLILTFVLGLGFAGRALPQEPTPQFLESARARLEELRAADTRKRSSVKLTPGVGYVPVSQYSIRELSFVGQPSDLCDVGCIDGVSPTPCSRPNNLWFIDREMHLDGKPPANPYPSLIVARYGPMPKGCKPPGGGLHGYWMYELELREGYLAGAYPDRERYDGVPTNDELFDMVMTTGPESLVYIYARDRDRDGFPNDSDACPDVAGVKPDGCPKSVPPIDPPPPAGETVKFRCLPCPPVASNPNPGVRSTGRLRNELLPPDYRMEVELFCPCGVERNHE